MNWKRALLVVVLLGFAFVLLVTATIGVAVTSVVAAVADSGVVEPVFDAVSEVVDDAERLQINVDDTGVTITNLDNGRSRIIETEPRFRGDRSEIILPRVTITDPDSGDSRVIVPDMPERFPSFVFENDEHVVYWPNTDFGPNQVFAPLGFFFRGLTTLMALALVATGAWLLLRNRRAKEEAETL